MARRCKACRYDEVELRGRFAQFALEELDLDRTWERLVVGLARLFPGPPEAL